VPRRNLSAPGGVEASMRISPVLLALLALAVLPAGACAASWSAPQTLTRSGKVFGPALANGTNGGVAVAYVRNLNGVQRAELRNGTLSGSLRSPVVLDSSTHFVFQPATAIATDGRAVVAWLRYLDGNHRVRATSVRRDGHLGPVRTLTGGGQSAYDPSFLAAADGETYLGWTRRAFSQAVPFAGGPFAPYFTLPFTGIGGSPARAVDATGTMVAVWTTSDGRVLASQARAGEAFSAPAQLAPDGRAPQITAAPDGTIVATWTTAAGIVAAARPSGGDFGAPMTVVAGPTTAAHVIASAAREVLVTWVDANHHLRLQRFTPGLQPIGAPIDLGAGDETNGVALARDPSAVFAAWTVRGTGAVRVRRIAPAGIIGPSRTLASRSLLRGSAPTTAAGAVAWVNGGGRLLLSRYR
jgi:hypothetical protein